MASLAGMASLAEAGGRSGLDLALAGRAGARVGRSLWAAVVHTGTQMPEEWSASGARLPLSLEVCFTGDPVPGGDLRWSVEEPNPNPNTDPNPNPDLNPNPNPNQVRRGALVLPRQTVPG